VLGTLEYAEERYHAMVSTVVKEIGVALLFAFIAGAIFLLGQLMYAQLVLMPRLITGGNDSLAVGVEVRWAVLAAAVAFAAYLISRLRLPAKAGSHEDRGSSSSG
jgi:hypothetical protein